MGVVYEAEQISLKRKVALKVLRFGVTTDADVMQRFQREAETVAHLHHTNIVPIHAVGCEQGVHYYAMQFIEGRSLADVLQVTLSAPQSDDRDFKQIVGWMLQGAEALAHAHQRGVIHRDIKPSNLILDPDGTVWLTDFGLAKRADEVTMTAAGVVMGTPRYMSPEQAAAARQPIDHRTDIYSLGATFYELATGKPVFDSQTPQGVITQILNSEPVAPRILQGKLPRDLETIILKCLAKEPSKRYQHARELADDLRAYLENRPIRARRASLIERVVRWSRKHRRSTIVSLASVAASLMAIALGFIGWNAWQQSLLGKLVLTTEGPSLVAEVLNDQDELVVPSFPVPHPDPIVVPGGSYRVRLSASGTLSEIWHMDVARGQVNSYAVKLIDRTLGPPIPIKDQDPPALVNLNGQPHFFHRGERGWRLTRGDTLQSAWGTDLPKFPQNPQEAEHPQTAVWGAWQDILQVESYGYGHETGRAPGITAPTADINGDSRDDLILASRVSPSLVAVSGSDARVLWWYRAAPVTPPEHNEIQDPIELKSSSEEAGVVGQPILVGLNGEPTVVAVFASIRSQVRTKSGREYISIRKFYLEAVTARTGKRVWRTSFELPELANLSVGDLVKCLPSQPALMNFDKQQVILLDVNSKVLGFDLINGQPAWPAVDIGGRSLRPLQFTDVTGDAKPEAIVVQPIAESRGELVALQVYSLLTGKKLWEQSHRPTVYNNTSYHDPNLSRRIEKELEWVTDLDGDGKPEIITSTADDWDKSGQHWYAIQALDAATGKPRWECRLWQSRFTFSSGGGDKGGVRLLIGPDLNGDGSPELITSSSYSKFTENHHVLQLDLISGRDGKVLWRRELVTQGSPPDGTLKLWQTGEDGWPQLVVPMLNGSQPATYLLSLSTGKLNGILPEVSHPQFSDLDSDGVLDLFYLSETQGSRRLTALKGLPAADWRRTGRWDVGQDYDGDGEVDFLRFHSESFGPSHLEAHSGRDLRLLWKSPIQPFDSRRSLLTNTDINEDGTMDIVTFENASRTQIGSYFTVGAISGKDGQRLWKEREIARYASSKSCSGGGAWCNYQYPFLDRQDLDGDGKPEIIIATNIGNENNTISLAALSRTDGQLLWHVPMLDGAYTGSSLIDRHLWHDLNGDGTLDIVLWTPDSFNEHQVGVGSAVRAISGKNGQTLWKATGLTHTWFLWPRTAIGDLDGDGQAEVVLTTNDGKGWDQKSNGFNCELVVLDGRSGNRKWSWGWTASNLDLCPPLLLNMDGDGKRYICVGAATQKPNEQFFAISILDAQGKIRKQFATGWCSSMSPWMATDIDGNGREELLHLKDSQLIAYSPSEDRIIWRWAASLYGCALKELRAEPAGDAPTLVVWRDRTVFGLNIATGTPCWRCDIPRQENSQLSIGLGFPTVPGRMPTVVSHGQQVASTIAQKARPTTATGAYQTEIAPKIQFCEYRLPVRTQPLPWRYYRGPAFMQFIAFLMFLFPLLNWVRLGNWKRVAKYLFLYGLVTAGIGYLIATYLSRPLEPGGIYHWEGWYLILYIGGAVMGLLTFIAATSMYLIRQLVRRMRKTRHSPV